jgi:hypothetical protein
MSQNDNNEKYKLIVIVGTGMFLLWGFAAVQDKVSDYSTILGWIVGPILIYFIYKIMKAIWPDIW